MTLTRWLPGLTLVLCIALPPPEAGAMFTKDAVIAPEGDNNANRRNATNDNPNDAPANDNERAAEADPAVQAAAIGRGLARDTQKRQRRVIESSVARMLLDADDAERPAVAARLGQTLEDFDLLDKDEMADVAAAVAASLAPPAAAVAASSSSVVAALSSTPAAKAASAAAAPAPKRGTFSRKGNATDIASAARDPLARGLPQPRAARGIPTEIGPADLGATEARESHSELRRLLSIHIGRQPRGIFRDSLHNVRDALTAADALLPALGRKPVGRLPPDLAEGLVEAGDRAGRAASATGRAPDTFVRSLSDPATGINAARLEDREVSAPMDQVAALGRLIVAADVAARNEVPGTELQRALEKVGREALDDRTRLVAFLQETARSFPGAFATVRLPADQLGTPVSGGLNSAPRPLRYDFGSRTVRTSGPATALFKPTEVPTLDKPLRDGGLSATGVVEFPEMPSRLEHRSVATRRIAELLQIGDLVVQTEFAQLDDPAQTFGLLMSRAPGESGIVERVEFPPDSRPFLAYMDVQSRIAEVKAMIGFLDGTSGANKPPTPLVTAAEPASVGWNRAAWISHGTDLENRLLDIPIRDVGTPGQERLVEVKQERPITDAHLADPDLRRQLSNAQWLDLLCGQVDRHMGNLFIATDGAAPVVTLIDNDLSFGIRNDIYGLDRASSVPDFRLPPKPFTVDAAFKQKFTALSQTSLREATRGLLTQKEQDALAQRFAMLKSYMNSNAVTEVYPPDARGRKVERRWSDAPALLFRGHDNRNPNPTKGDEYSYYGILSALPPRPSAAPAPGGK